MPERYERSKNTPPGFRELYRRTPVMMHAINAAGHLLTVSDLWLETLGYERDEVVGTPLAHYLPELSRKQVELDLLPRFFSIGKVLDLPFQMVKKNGEVMDVMLSAVARRDGKGRIVASMAGLVDVTEFKKAEAKAFRRAHYDTLTGQPNRLLLQDRLHQAIAQGHREGRMVGLMFLDLDRFKWVNDTLGHAAGDSLLCTVAERLTECIRDCDTVARMGGDEFVIILYGIATAQDPAHFAERFLRVLSLPVQLQGHKLFNTASIGIAVYPLDGEDAETLLRKADIAMYSAKEKGRNNFQFYSAEMTAWSEEKLRIENNLRQALQRDELFLVYQPQVNLTSGRIVGIEALLRWQHPRQGVISAVDFIHVAEETGLILTVGEWVLRTACAQAQAWQLAGLPPLRMAINISGRQFNRPDFLEMVEGILKETGLDPGLLELELTESVVMEHVPDAILILTDLKVRRIKLAIDDFGTGYSSLVYLKHFPFDRLKIAQEFIRDIAHDQDDLAIVEAVIAMARTLKLEVIAEGVEERVQLDFLCERHCCEMQGYYLSRPLLATEIPALVRTGFVDIRTIHCDA